MALAPTGQDRALSHLRAAARGQRLHHAYLISGLPGSGVREVGEWFARLLLCPSCPEDCDGCPSCDRAERGLHPDLLRVGLDADAKDVKVEAIRDLCAAMQLKPAEGRRRVALIAQAELMSPSAQNALLKTLEEPPPHSVLLLTTEVEDRLLPTIRSRCARLRLAAPVALNILRRDDDRLAKRRAQVIEHLQTLLREGGKPTVATVALELAEGFADGRDAAKETLEIIASCLRDVLAARGGAKPEWLLAPERAGALTVVAQGRSEAELFRGLDRIAEAMLALEGNASPRLQVEAAALRLGGVT